MLFWRPEKGLKTASESAARLVPPRRVKLGSDSVLRGFLFCRLIRGPKSGSVAGRESPRRTALTKNNIAGRVEGTQGRAWKYSEICRMGNSLLCQRATTERSTGARSWSISQYASFSTNPTIAPHHTSSVRRPSPHDSEVFKNSGTPTVYLAKREGIPPG